MNGSVYLGLSILDLSRTVVYDIWYDYIKQIDRPLPKGKNKKVIGLMKDELGEQIMKEFIGLRAKTYIYLKEKMMKMKNAKGTKKCVIKRKVKFQDYKN